MLKSKWRVPAACALFAGVYLGIFLARGELLLAIITSSIMLGYGTILLLWRGRSDVAAVLSEYRSDERRQQITLRAGNLSLNVSAAVVVTGALVEFASGHYFGPWVVMGGVIGASFIVGVIFYSRRA